ncbi:MAG: flagellar protein FlaG [Lutisporaceae bacterium]
MRIENGVSNSQRVPVNTATEARPQNDSVKTRDIRTTESYQNLAHKPELQLSMDEKQWINLIERANKALNGGNRNFEFSIHEATKEIVVKVIDTDTNEVIREIPNEKILDMVAKMWEMAGIFVDERR